MAELYDNLKNVLDGLAMPYEIICVDDGSIDETCDRLLSLAKTDRALKIIRLNQRYGQTAAVGTGIRASSLPVIVTMDGDLQNDPEDIPRLIEELDKGYDLVCGWRKYRQDSFINRRLPSMIANMLISKMFGLNIHDSGCGIMAHRAEMIKSIRLENDMHRFIPALVQMRGGKIMELVVRHHPRKSGKSKYGIWRVFSVARDTLLLKYMYLFSGRKAQGIDKQSDIIEKIIN
ncbi:MAG: glycosyltransferase family 2 protein [Candidatus Magnetominusculus sp. LBB02]|nr:glycosyltransferase family 2 protein [Candidatus Magnetominusculus sp. LBB02]